MELKVWVEGIQRIVCGVNEKTTCQDVVFALAHATGKTGRFTLIERWRNSERLIAPNEQPLKVLLKWGEHSNDVQFILQWAPLETGPKAPNPKLSSENPSSIANLPKIIHGNPAVVGPLPSASNPNPAAVRKISHSSSSPLAFTESDEMTPQPPNVDNMSVDRIISKRKESSSDFMRSVYSARDLLPSDNECSKTVPLVPAEPFPPPYRDPPIPTKGNLPSPKPPLPPYRDPPPPNQRQITHKTTNNSPISKPSPSIASGVSGTISSIVGSPNSELSNSSCSTSHGSPISESKNSINTVQPGVSNHLRALLQQHILSQGHSLAGNSNKMSQSPISMNDSAVLPSFEHPSENQASSSSNGPSPASTATISSSPEQSASQNSSQYHDLIKIINSQRQKLTSQQAELTKHDAEILFWEGKAKEQQRHMELINKEISRLELLCVQHESQVLSLSHLEEENNLLTTESESMNSQISKLRTELDSCDNELHQCRDRIHFLTEELQLIQEEVKSQEEERLQGEANAAAEIEELKKELELAKREAETVSDISGSLEKEVSSLEQSLADKKKKMEVLVSAMKEANLQSLTIQPSADELMEGGPYCRSGIQRRIIGSPRQLEYSAPTTKNPHGVWV